MSKATEKAAGRALHPLTHLASTDLRRVARDVRRHELQRLTKRIRFLETSASSQRDGDGDEEKGAKTVAADRRNKNFLKRGRKLDSLRMQRDGMAAGTASPSDFVACVVAFGCRELGLKPYGGVGGQLEVEAVLDRAVRDVLDEKQEGEEGNTITLLFDERKEALRSAVNKVLTHPKLLEITSNLTTAVTDYLRFKIRWDNDRKRRDTETGEDSNTDSAQNELKQPKDNYDDNDDETKCFQLWKDQRKRRLRKNVVAMGNSKPSENKGHPIFCPDRKNSEYSKKHSGGLFVDSLGSAMTAYGPAGVEGNYDEDGNWVRLEQKKNRMGQRARKAKAMAMEAAKKGQRWDSSINWREKNKKKRSHDEKEESSAPSRHKTTSGLDVSTNASAVANMGKKWKETGNAHPSWAARELAKQRTKIIISANPSSSSSSGKRIKFNVDDD